MAVNKMIIGILLCALLVSGARKKSADVAELNASIVELEESHAIQQERHAKPAS